MAREYRKPRGRPATWPSRVTAPPLARELYTLIARLARTPGVFAECHPFEGAMHGEVPVIKWEGKVTKLPHVIASHLGLPLGGKQCHTPGCCNPFHYLGGDMGDNVLASRDTAVREETFAYASGVDDWVELVDYELDKRGFRVGDVSFAEVRQWILPEDLTDAQLQTAITKMKGDSQHE